MTLDLCKTAQEYRQNTQKQLNLEKMFLEGSDFREVVLQMYLSIEVTHRSVQISFLLLTWGVT